MNTKIELLSPAKNIITGTAAINCGADAVYIGAPKFGARAAAGNSLRDIEALVKYAHKFGARVYAAVNTVIYDDELAEAERLIHQLYDIGTDAVIFQDTALLKMDLPPIPLFASTQTHNYETERIKFFDSLGIKRIILARELSLNRIREIKKVTNCELEFFVHGALCVSLSGQCYMSMAAADRSANRGECAQPCRMHYSLTDESGKVIIKDKYLLSLKDLNLSAYLNDLLEAGITSFKIEGRLKDTAYVKNVTAFYRQRLDEILAGNPAYSKSSVGKSHFPFSPDPDKTFNRGYTTYFMNGKDNELTSANSPKSKGKLVGRVVYASGDYIQLESGENIIPGDGLCYLNKEGVLDGMQVNKVAGNKIYTNKQLNIKPGTEVYRNYNHQFNTILNKSGCLRKIDACITIKVDGSYIVAGAADESGIKVSKSFPLPLTAPGNRNTAEEIIRRQFGKSGNTIFNIISVKVELDTPVFISIKDCNQMRRDLLSLLEEERIKLHHRENFILNRTDAVYPASQLSYKGNVVNVLARAFYKEHGVSDIDDGFEINESRSCKILMTCKYCIKDELDSCPLKGPDKYKSSNLYLLNNGRKYRLHFNCKDCLMEISAVE